MEQPVDKPVVKKKTEKKPVKPVEEVKPEVVKPEASAATEAPDAAAAGAAASVNPPSTGDGAAPPPASSAESAAAAPPLDTTGVGNVAAAEKTEEQAPVRDSSPIGTVLMIAGLAVGLFIVVRLTMRRRQDEEISIFDRSPAPRAPRPPIAHHP